MKYPGKILTLITGILLAANLVSGQSNTNETVWLQLNRDLFLAGEDINFKAEILDVDTYKASDISKSVRLELIDSKGNIISRTNLAVNNSSTRGSISLPVSLPSGWYYLRSYTNWMRNFPQGGFTVSPVRVLNHYDITNKSLLYKNDDLKVLLLPHNTVDSSIKANYSIYTSYRNTMPVSSEGIALNHTGDTLFRFKTDESGWGLVNSDNTLREGNLVISLADSIYPDIDIQNENVNSLNKQSFTVEKGHGYLNISIPKPEPDKEYKLLLHKQFSWSWFESRQSSVSKLVFRIPLRLIPSGISQISLFDNNNKLLCSRLWSDYNRHVKEVNISISNEKLDTDSSYSFDYLLSGDYLADSTGSVSILVEKTLESIKKNFYLPGLPGWSANYDIPSGEEAFLAWLNANSYPDAIPSALIARVTGLNVTDNKLTPLQSPKYWPEKESDILQGRLSGQGENDGLENVYLGLTILSNNDFYTTASGKDGLFRFELSGNEGKQDFVLGFVESSDITRSIKLESNFVEDKKFARSSHVFFTGTEFEFLRDQNITNQLKTIYGSPEAEREEVTAVPESFYGSPEFSIIPSNYIDLPDIENLIYETIPSISIRRKENGMPNLKVNSLKNEAGEYPPLILLDGLVYNNLSDLLKCSPENISSIDIITGHYINGLTVFDGLVSFKSKEGNLGGLRLPSETILSSIILPQAGREKRAYTALRTDEYYPSFEEVLSWIEKQNELSGSISFSTNNLPGKYSIRVYAYDGKGRWHSGIRFFNISID